MPEALPDVTPEVLDRVEAAAESDGLITDPLGSPSSATTNDSTPAVPATPEGAETQEGATAEADSFTKLDPNALPAEVRPYYDSMLGDYTRKTQEAAPWRKLGEELGISSPDEVRQAAELYAYLQDPQNLADFQRQLNEALPTGQPPAIPPAVATPEPAVDEFGDPVGDPAAALRPLEEKISALEARLTEQAQREEAERAHWALVGEVTRQEALLSEQHPEWKEDDWNAVYSLAPAYGGDLMQTANALEEFASARMASWINGKLAAQGTPGLNVPMPSGTAEEPRDISALAADDSELRGASAEAREYIRNVLSQSE